MKKPISPKLIVKHIETEKLSLRTAGAGIRLFGDVIRNKDTFIDGNYHRTSFINYPHNSENQCGIIIQMRNGEVLSIKVQLDSKFHPTERTALNCPVSIKN
jgi:hypothetical protein